MIRIARSKYEHLLQAAKRLDDNTLHDQGTVFTARNIYPAISDLESHHVRENFRKFMPYVLYYAEIYQTDDPEFVPVQDYLKDMCAECLDVVDDSDLEQIRKLTPSTWKKLTLEERADVLEPLISYYSPDEFEGFLEDLGWQRFMTAYGITQKKWKDGDGDSKMRIDLACVWDCVQTRPLPSFS